METNQDEDTTPTSLVDLPSVDSELELREDASSVAGEAESQLSYISQY